MSTRGFSLHLRETTAEEAEEILTRSCIPCAILGSNSGWTSFVPLDEVSFDIADVAESSGVTILQVWFDEDSAIVSQFFAPDGWQAEWYVPLDGTYDFGPEDERLFEILAERKLLSSDAAKALTHQLQPSGGPREEWLQSHGIEELFGLPSVVPMPVPCSEEILRELAPDARLVMPDQQGAVNMASALAATEQAPGLAPRDQLAATRRWGSLERAVVDLHFYYLMRLWNLNDWKVYYRYKKHLPAERRREVDELVNLKMTGASAERVRQALEAILSTIWDNDDWYALIRDPALLRYEPLDQAQLRDWQRRLEAVDSARGRA